MISLSEDTIFRVRKATAAQIGIICKVVEPEVRLLIDACISYDKAY